MKFRRNGFTLIELLIVVLILGALAAIAIPRITQSTDTAKQNACMTNVDLINSQVELYYARTGSYPTSLDTLTNDPNYFPEGAPDCPVNHSAYTLDAEHRVTGHNH